MSNWIIWGFAGFAGYGLLSTFTFMYAATKHIEFKKKYEALTDLHKSLDLFQQLLREKTTDVEDER